MTRDPAYLNCPMNENEYVNFRDQLIEGQQATLKDFEKESANFKLFTHRRDSEKELKQCDMVL